MAAGEPEQRPLVLLDCICRWNESLGRVAGLACPFVRSCGKLPAVSIRMTAGATGEVLHLEIQWPFFTRIRKRRMALLTRYLLVLSLQGILAFVVRKERRDEPSDGVARFTRASPFMSRKLPAMRIPVAICAFPELHRCEPLDRTPARWLSCRRVAALARNARVPPVQGESGFGVIEVPRCPDLPTSRRVAALTRLLELLLVRVPVAIRAPGRLNSSKSHSLDLRARLGMTPLTVHHAVLPRQREGRPPMVEPGRRFPGRGSMAGPAVLRELPPMRILVAGLTR